MNIWFLRVMYFILGFLSFLVPSLVLAAVVKVDLNINIPFVVFLLVPIYLAVIGVKNSGKKYSKILSHHLTGFFIVSVIFFFGGIVLLEYNPKELLASQSFAFVLCLAIYILSIFLSIKVGHSIALRDNSFDMDTESDKVDFTPWGFWIG